MRLKNQNKSGQTPSESGHVAVDCIGQIIDNQYFFLTGMTIGTSRHSERVWICYPHIHFFIRSLFT